MLLVMKVKGVEMNTPTAVDGTVFERLNSIKSAYPAITHVDGSARVQTVNSKNGFVNSVLSGNDLTGHSLVNTSFNVRGEPIVETPVDAIRCFSARIDFLVLGRCLVRKRELPASMLDPSFKDNFEKD